MKQIDIIRTYAQKRCLVVDSEPDARAQLKRIMVDFGTLQTDTVGNAEEAIDFCQKKTYDIVISDYNLGKGKSGQQLLEELRFHHLLKNTSIFILISSENASHYVLHALEYEPDDFLQKPINRDSLRPRLDNALLKNEYLLKIKDALDAGNIRRAIAAAEEIAFEPDKYQIDAQKILAELYLKNAQISEAKSIYEGLKVERLPLWADLGLAKIEYALKQDDAAEKRLHLMISDNPYYVDARDLLAKVYERTHRGLQSQQTLINAVTISPHYAVRQRELGRISLDIDDENTSVHAFRSAIKHSKNSCHENPDDQLNLADALVRLSKKSDPKQARALLTEAHACLSHLEKLNGNHPIIMMRNKLMIAEIADAEGHHEKSEQAVEQALALHRTMSYSVIGNTAKQLCIDCAKSFMNTGCYDEGDAILKELARINTDADYALKIDRLLRVPQTKEGIAFAAKLNKEGITYYEQNKLDDAIRSFTSVSKELPNHIGLNLNLVQALISKSKTETLNNKEIHQLQSSFKRIGKISGDEPFFKRYDYLFTRFQKLKRENN